MLFIRDTVFWDVSRDFLRFRQRADPLVIVKLLRGRVFIFREKRQLRVEQEAALFRQVSRGQLDREIVKAPEQAPPLASSCEGDSGIQVFLPFTSRTRSAQFDAGQRSDACFAPSLLPLGAPWLHISCCSGKRPRTLLTQDLVNQIADLFQLGVPVDTLGGFSKEQATRVAAEHCTGLLSARGSFETFCLGRGVTRDHTSRECPPMPGGARRAAACLLQSERRPGWGSSEPGCRPKVVLEVLAANPEGVADRLPYHRPLRPVARVVVCPGRCLQREVRGEECRTRRSCTALRSDGAVHTILAIEPTHLSHTVFKQHLTSVLLPHMLLGVGNWDALHTAKVFPGSLGCCFGRGCLLEFSIVGGGGAGRAADAAGESEIRRF